MRATHTHTITLMKIDLAPLILRVSLCLFYITDGDEEKMHDKHILHVIETT